MTEIKIVLHYTIKSFIVICFIVFTVSFLVSWSNEPTYIESKEDETLKEIYNPVTFEQKPETFYKRYDVNNIIDELTISQIHNVYNRETHSYIIVSSIFKEAIRQNVPVNLAFAIAKVESNFNPSAINYNHTSTDYGLFQLNNSYRNWSEEDFFNINKNTQEGIRYLKEMMDLFEGDILKALAAYNCGPTRVLNNRIPKSTEMYITKVLEAEDEFNILFNNYLKNM